MGQQTRDIGHLAGRDERNAPWSPWLREWNQTRQKVEWLLRSASGCTVTVSAQTQRAGKDQQELILS